MTFLGVMELTYNQKRTHWKHGGIVGVFGYGGGVIGRYCDQPDLFPEWPTFTPCASINRAGNFTTPSPEEIV